MFESSEDSAQSGLSDQTDHGPGPSSKQIEAKRRSRRRKIRRRNVCVQVSDSSSDERDASDNEAPRRQGPLERHLNSSSSTDDASQIMEGDGEDAAVEDSDNEDEPVRNLVQEAEGDNEMQEDFVDNLHPNAAVIDSESSEHERANLSTSTSDEHSSEIHVSDGSDIGSDEERLFEGSPVSFGQYMLAILVFALRHKLSGRCLSDLLTLISLICPPANRCTKTLYKFKKYFSMIGRSILKFHYFCSGCESPLANAESICNLCEERPKVSYFLEVPLMCQLQSLFIRPGFYECLQFRFTRVKRFEENIEDIYDGEIYRKEVEDGFLRNPNYISFTWYTDGIAIFKSSNFSIWPMYLIINELNYKMWTQRENILVAGIWFGNSKPNTNVFLSPLNSNLESLKTDGFLFERSEGAPILVKAKMLCGTCDLQAKCRFMCLKQWNGFFGCTCCMIRGERFFLENNKSVHVYPYTPNVEPRNNDDIPEFAEQAVRNRQYDPPNADVYGVKGLSRLYFMLPNMILCMGVDAMHGISGLIKLITSLWFDSTYAGLPFSVHHLLHVVDQRLKNLRPPSYVQKVPRSISEAIAFWKALEFKLWFFYYSLTVLLGVLPENYWNHHCKLVSAIAILHQESISHEQLDVARALLNSYLEDFATLYGLRHMSMNVHQLIHYPDAVLNLGPVWVYSCFVFEDLNGKIAALVHGSRHAAMQISSSVSAFFTLPARLNALDQNNVVRSFCERMQISGRTSYKVILQINPDVQIVGSFVDCNPIPALVRNVLRNDFNLQNGRCRYFYKLKIKNVLYVASSYKRIKTKLSCYSVVEDDQLYLCKITNFVRWTPCDRRCLPKCQACPARFFCLLEIFERIPWEVHDVPDVRMSYLDRVRPSGGVRAFSVESLRMVCFYMSVDRYEYIASPVNHLETE